jgi:ABC-type lipoprotein export system ATPase subunit
MILNFEQIIQIYNRATTPRKVLDIAKLSIPQGHQILLRGVSGSGKTTFFNVAAGLLQPTSGAVRYGEVDLYALSEAQRDAFRAQHIGYIFQTHHLLNALTALENVIMPMAFAKRLPHADRRKRALELLDLMGLADHAQHYPAQLSTGQRMRVAVARAIANQPVILFADEPTASLDQTSAESVMNTLQATCQTINATLLVASHDPALAPRFQQWANLKDGQLQIQQATATAHQEAV